ncbi:ribosomal protein S18 acetylase RimI-like enzyme [Deinobacterium chartae]|uniref:Ribosomal protein S18 acetylase RimI-like enzyme n=1 Tax=Deinobacterium chartae TaxID=521158 RepID=A0A841HX05_9DEIO|nr:GNAT family N-acetyltransferase [Deinobacterium chartae]MBB6097174.1 ribosomal protein S18 acetylase RimI-like enzyme [Deinobacterium chartae]
MQQITPDPSLSPALTALLAHALQDASALGLEAALARYRTSDHLLLVHPTLEVPQGIIGLRRLGPERAAVVHLAVDPALRRRGIGRELIAGAVLRFGLTVLEAQSDAQTAGFYRALGFEVTPLDPTDPDAQRFRCLWQL